MKNKISISFHNKTVLISGGSRGIGKATGLAFASLGANVAFSYKQNTEAAEEATELIRQLGVKSLAVQCDVAVEAEVALLVDRVLQEFGQLDILVCNAGVWEGAAVDEMDEPLWSMVVDSNLRGTWALCKAAIPAMKRQRHGSIIIVSSTAGQRGEANYSAYAAAKGGQISFTKSLAMELGAFGINVNAVAPGWVDTDMTRSVLGDSSTRSQIEMAIPLGRVASAEDIAWPILFLGSEWARHITGEVININGGSVLCG
jgi:3-oxoacyl-[acyl-carrier protein] reductase